MNVRTSEILRTRMAHNLDTRLGIRHSHVKHRVRPAHVIERRSIHDGKPARLVELHRSNVLLIDIDRERSAQRARVINQSPSPTASLPLGRQEQRIDLGASEADKSHRGAVCGRQRPYFRFRSEVIAHQRNERFEIGFSNE